MALVQVRDVSDDTLRSLKARAAERGQSLSSYLRDELDDLAARPTNADVVERLRRRSREAGPSSDMTVDEVRGTRETA